MPVRRLLGGFSALAGTMLVTQAIGFAALALASRELGPNYLGAANFATNITIYFAIPANFGLALLGMRDIAREPERAREIAGQILTLRLGIAIASAGTLAATAPLIAPNANTQALLPLAALAIPLDALSAEWVLLGCERRVATALARLAGQALYAVLIFTLLVSGLTGAHQFIYFTLLGVAITSVLTQVRSWQVVGRPHLGHGLGALRGRAAASVPLGIAVVMVQVAVSAGIMMLGYLESNAAVGQFTVAQKLPLALYAIVQLWSATLYPQVARLMGDGHEALREKVALFTSLSAALALPLVAGAAILGTELIPAMFGERYAPAGDAFVILCGSLAIALLTVNVGSVLAAGGQERAYAAGRTLGAVVSLAGCAVTIPLLGLDGAAVALLAAEATTLVFMLRRYHRVVGGLRVEWGRVARAVAATVAMSGVLFALGTSTGVAVRLAAGAATYVAAALLLGVVRREELRGMLPARSRRAR